MPLLKDLFDGDEIKKSYHYWKTLVTHKMKKLCYYGETLVLEMKGRSYITMERLLCSMKSTLKIKYIKKTNI